MKLRILAIGKAGGSIGAAFNVHAEASYYLNTHKTEMDLMTGEYFDPKANYSDPRRKRPIKFCIDGKGTGRSPKIGTQLANHNIGFIEKWLKVILGDYKGLLMLVVGGGGGTGTGFAPVVCEVLNGMGINYGIIYTLPLNHEGQITIANALNGLATLSTQLKEERVAPFFICDNQLLQDEAKATDGNGDWDTINERITNLMLFTDFLEREVTDTNTFNTIDEREFVRFFRMTKAGGIGYNDIKSFDIDMKNISASLTDGLRNLSDAFCPGYDYKSCEGLLAVLEQPAKHKKNDDIDELFANLSKRFRGKKMLKSTVSTKDDSYRLSILFSGLNPPLRIKKLNSLVSSLIDSGKKKRESKAKTKEVKKFSDEFQDIDL